MTVYTNYDFYITKYGGDLLDEFTFDKAARKASAHLDKITYGRIKEYKETSDYEVQMCVCEMAERIRAHETSMSNGKMVRSVSNQGYSETYAVPEDTSATQMLYFDLMDIAMLYLPYELLSLCIYDEV